VARDFSKDAANYMTIGVDALSPVIAGASAVSMHGWAHPDTFTATANFNRLISVTINSTSAGLVLSIHNGTTAVVRVGARSATADAFQTGNGTSAVSTGAWSSIGGVVNYGAATITPYYNGAAEGGGAVTFGSATYADDGTPTGSDMVGSDNAAPTASACFDGRLAEVAIWTADIGASGFAALAKGVSALAVRPDALVFYMPLVGKYSPERDIVGGKSGTITGTVAGAAHPRLYTPRRTKVRRFTTAAGGGGGTGGPLVGSSLIGSILIGSRLLRS
jgi:hypothetical protein